MRWGHGSCRPGVCSKVTGPPPYGHCIRTAPSSNCSSSRPSTLPMAPTLARAQSRQERKCQCVRGGSIAEEP
eukprot:9565720-Prorocentrum_lima.AAC.1